MRGAHRIAIDPPCRDPLAAPALDRVVEAEQHWTPWHKRCEQQAQQQARGPASAPARAIENAMVIDKPALAAQPRDPQ
jgi:hypothetical protein